MEVEQIKTLVMTIEVVLVEQLVMEEISQFLVIVQ